MEFGVRNLGTPHYTFRTTAKKVLNNLYCKVVARLSGMDKIFRIVKPKNWKQAMSTGRGILTRNTGDISELVP